MKRFQRPATSRLRFAISLGVVLFGIYGFSQFGWAQNSSESTPLVEKKGEVKKQVEASESDNSDKSTKTESKPSIPVVREAVAPPDKPLPAIEDAEPKEKPKVLEQIDSAFAKAVEYMAGVLFYRLGAQTEKFVSFTAATFMFARKGVKGHFRN